MAKIANTRKAYKFVVEVDGVDQFLIQKLTLPELGAEVSEHGEGVHKVKTLGMATVGDMTMEKIKKSTTMENWAYNWFKAGVNLETEISGLASEYKRDMVIRELDERGNKTLTRHIIEGACVNKLSQSDFDRMSSDNIVETLTLSVDKYYRR